MNDIYSAVKKHINTHFQPQKYMTPPQDQWNSRVYKKQRK